MLVTNVFFLTVQNGYASHVDSCISSSRLMRDGEESYALVARWLTFLTDFNDCVYAPEVVDGLVFHGLPPLVSRWNASMSDYWINVFNKLSINYLCKSQIVRMLLLFQCKAIHLEEQSGAC